jgi:hypothetical protein
MLSLQRVTTVRANRAIGQIDTNDGSGDRYHVPLSPCPLISPRGNLRFPLTVTYHGEVVTNSQEHPL